MRLLDVWEKEKTAFVGFWCTTNTPRRSICELASLFVPAWCGFIQKTRSFLKIHSMAWVSTQTGALSLKTTIHYEALKLAVWLNFLEKKSSGLFSVTRGGNVILFVIKRRSHLQKLSFHGRKNWGEVAQYCTQRLIDRQNLRSDCLAALQPGCHRNKC